MPKDSKSSSHVLLYSLLAILGILLLYYVFRQLRRCGSGPSYSTSPHTPQLSDEVALLRERIIADFAKLRGRLPTHAEIKAELAKLRGQYRSALDRLREKVKSSLTALRGRLPSPAEVHDEIAKLIANIRGKIPSSPSQPSPPPKQVEVFWVRSPSVAPGADSEAVCAAYGASVATVADLQAAIGDGASWCNAATVADDDQSAYWPNQYTDGTCGSFGLNYQTLDQGGPLTSSGVNCIGVKPSDDGSDTIAAFNSITGQWSEYQ